MGNGIFGIAISGLGAAQAGLVTTGHNIANASTPGFHRQSIEQSAAPGLFTGSGFFGQGVQIDTVVRAYDRFLEQQVARSAAQSSYYAAYQAQIERIDNLLGDSTTGLSPALQAFFGAVQSVAADPPSIPSRQSMISAGASLVARFNQIASQFNDIRSGINSQITSAVGQINAYAQQIAALNSRILVAQNNPSQPPNDLYDQRDALVAQLNGVIGTSTVQQSDGTISVFIGNGQSLVVGAQATTLSAMASPDDPLRTEVGYSTGAGTATLLNSASLTGGRLGALIAFRSADLDGAQNALGVLVQGLAHTFNDQQKLGQDLNGAIGTDFFSVPAPAVIDRSTNTGTAVITATISAVTALVASDYRLSFSGGNYTLLRLSDNTSSTFAALPQTVDGITFTLTGGAPANGDNFLVQPTRDAARAIGLNLTDPRGVAAAAPMRTAAPGSNTGNATISAGSVNGPPPVNVNLQQPVTITFTSANTFDVTGAGTGNPVGVAYTSGGNISYNGWSVQISGTPSAGDVFTIGPNSGGIADGRNALLLAGLQTQNLLAGGTTTYQGIYSQLVGRVGSQAQQIGVAAESHAALAVEALQAQQSVVGVNLDEEAANLLRYQQAYQAAGKVIQIASTLFDTILELGK